VKLRNYWLSCFIFYPFQQAPGAAGNIFYYKTHFMLAYLSKDGAVADMHQRGFIHDFHLFGNDLLWVQEKIFIRMGDFAIIEHHRFFNSRSKRMEAVVFGVVSNYYQVKGILLNDYASHTRRIPPVIVKKLNELNDKAAFRFNS
jgi:hypothetical protein